MIVHLDEHLMLVVRLVQQAGAALEHIIGADPCHVQRHDDPPRYAREGQGQCVAACPSGFSPLLPSTIRHDTTLQGYRLPSVTATVTKWSSERTSDTRCFPKVLPCEQPLEAHLAGDIAHDGAET